jgi:hypothetical protein
MVPDSACPERMQFQVRGTHKNACGDAVAYVDTVNVTFYTHLVANATPNNAVCAVGGTVVLNAHAHGGKAPYTFAWKNAAGQTLGSANEIAVNASGNYTVHITDAVKTVATQTVSVSPAKFALPSNIRFENVKQQDVTVEWQPVAQANRYAVRCRAKGTTNWNTRRTDAVDAIVKLKDLQPATTYELQLMAFGNADSSGWTAMQTFSTEGPCMDANNLRNKIKNGDAWFYWTQNPYCVRQELVLKAKGARDWERTYKLAAKANSVAVNHLKSGIEYEWAIKSYCPAGGYNGVKDFTISQPSYVSMSPTSSGAVAANAQP